MPKVKLLRKPHETFVLAFGRSMFEFKGDTETEVPMAVALLCKSKKSVDGDPLFKVDIPDETIVNIVHAPKELAKPQKVEVTQNLSGSIFQQLRFGEWPLSL